MKKIIFNVLSLLLIIHTSLFSLDAWGVESDFPSHQSQGVPITHEEWLRFADFCFYTRIQYIDSYEENPIMDYRLYANDQSGRFIIGYGEYSFRCVAQHLIGYEDSSSQGIVTERDYVTNLQYDDTFYRRSPVDRCFGLDIVTGQYLSACDSSTGEWYYLPNYYEGSWDPRSQTYDCYEYIDGKYIVYPGSTYVNILIAKYRFAGTITDAGYLWQSYACVKDSVENQNLNVTVKVTAPSRTCVGINCEGSNNYNPGSGSGSSGSSSGTDVSSLTPKLEDIKTQLLEIQSENSGTKTEFLGKTQDIKNDILLQNQQIAVNQNDLLYKLNEIQSKNDDLKLDLIDAIDTKTLELKDDIKNDVQEILNNNSDSLSHKISDNQDSIDNLRNQIESYNIDDVNGRNEILNRLSGLENSVNGLGLAIDNIGNGNGSGTGENTGTGGNGGDGSNSDLIGALNDGLGKIDNSLNQGLLDENNKPYLKSIDEILKGQGDSPDDTNDLNGIIGSEIGFAFNNYSNLFSSSNCSAPANISVVLMGTQYTLMDFSIIAPYVGYIKTVFFSLASLLGLMIFLRGSR